MQVFCVSFRNKCYGFWRILEVFVLLRICGQKRDEESSSKLWPESCGIRKRRLLLLRIYEQVPCARFIHRPSEWDHTAHDSRTGCSTPWQALELPSGHVNSPLNNMWPCLYKQPFTNLGHFIKGTVTHRFGKSSWRQVRGDKNTLTDKRKSAARPQVPASLEDEIFP